MTDQQQQEQQQQPGVPVPPMALIAERSCDHTYSDNAKYWAAWGANERLRLCVEWMKSTAMTKPWETVAQLADEMKAAMRPEPKPSRKQLALTALRIGYVHARPGFAAAYTTEQLNTIQDALEALDD